MNKNLIIALVIGAAALLAFFVLSSPTEETDPNNTAGGAIPGAVPGGNPPTATGGSDNSGLLASLLGAGSASNAGLLGSGTPKEKILAKVVYADKAPKADDYAIAGQATIDGYGKVTSYAKWGSLSNTEMIVIENTGEAIFPTDSRFYDIKSKLTQAIVASLGKLKIKV